MYKMDEVENKLFHNEFVEELNKRKNLMVYEEGKDGLEEKVKIKYCYSSPYDPLEFIIIDVYNKPVVKKISNKKVEIFGMFSIIKDEDDYLESQFDSIYGAVTISDICIRGIKKNEVTLSINNAGIQDLKRVMLYFEDYFCRKMQPSRSHINDESTSL